MGSLGRLDLVRRNMLAVMGIDVWIPRDVASRASSGDAVTAEPVSADSHSAVPPPAAVSAPQTFRPGGPTGVETGEVQVHGAALSVTCLVTDQVMMLIDGAPRDSGRMCADVLAAVTGCWTAQPRVIPFVWPASAVATDKSSNESEHWRAFKAFAEMRITESQVRVLLCSEGLVTHLPNLPEGCGVVALLLPRPSSRCWSNVLAHENAGARSGIVQLRSLAICNKRRLAVTPASVLGVQAGLPVEL